MQEAISDIRIAARSPAFGLPTNNQFLRPIATRGANANTTPAFRYVWGDYIDEPILRQTGSSTLLYYHHNQQYSTVALTSASGLVVSRYGYTAYGDQTILSHTGTSQTYATYSNRISYTGREWDDSLKAHYFRARWYDAAMVRFVNRDPMGYVDGMSLYRGYFGLSKLDPKGLVVPAIPIVVGASCLACWTSFGSIFNTAHQICKREPDEISYISCFLRVIDEIESSLGW